MERSIPGAYKVGGRHVRKPTGLPRDSSLRIDKAPGISFSCREAQTVGSKYRPMVSRAPEKRATICA
ncbi:hypothetical protein MPL1032_100105 [Mesorhizobium plurifarium]|uniref:Uncharacterized protein n=1 Tax=Mesorhizobium plurifarium TaxID=69974 RepID=A0A0K2VN91_MESPL|nr:hypothetical protein MPL1032_100105 [Mesorhizobium plurifarium]